MQIEEYILSIGLGTGAIGKDGGKNRGAGGEGEGGGRRSGEKRKKGQEREEKQENKKINKRKKSSASGDTAVVPSLPAQSSQTQVGVGVLVAGKDVEQALLGVRVTPHTKLLLSPDSELPWFELVSKTEGIGSARLHCTVCACMCVCRLVCVCMYIGVGVCTYSILCTYIRMCCSAGRYKGSTFSSVYGDSGPHQFSWS